MLRRRDRTDNTKISRWRMRMWGFTEISWTIKMKIVKKRRDQPTRIPSTVTRMTNSLTKEKKLRTTTWKQSSLSILGRSSNRMRLLKTARSNSSRTEATRSSMR